MEKTELEKLAKDAGFTNCRLIDTEVLQFDADLRKYCVMNYCGNYDKNYACPPDCGTPQEMEEQTKEYKKVLVLQTVTPVKDIANEKETKVIKHRHNQMTWELVDSFEKQGIEGLTVLAGPCGLCETCAKAGGEPCRFPKRKASCMSAYCIQVSALADYCELPYWCDGEVAFFSLYFIR